MYWLLKTDPDTYAWEDLKNEPKKTDHWEGVRNYQARNYLRAMKKGDLGLFYHSVIKPIGIFGVVRVTKEAYPDPTQFDPQSKYFDPKSSEKEPRWSVVDVKVHKELKPPITLDELRETPGLEDMLVLRKGQRLSVMPVKPEEWEIVLSLRK